jgi:RNA 2',3'-cyclic 3'-phosphodiesterase
VRLFAAVDLSRSTLDAMAAEQRRVASSLGKAAASLKWIAPDRAHLTLVFLGQVHADVLAPLVETMSQDIDAAPFDIVFSGRGVFPPRGAPRVFWAGIGGGIDRLQSLQREIVRRVVRHGIVLQAREFHPHLTLGRWTASRPSDAMRVLSTARRETLAQETVARVTLFESRLSSSGPTYSALAHANLTRT